MFLGNFSWACCFKMRIHDGLVHNIGCSRLKNSLTVEPRYNEPLHNEVLGITNLYITKSSVELTVFLIPAIVKYMEKNLDLTKPHYGEHILPVPLPFVMSRLHCTIYY